MGAVLFSVLYISELNSEIHLLDCNGDLQSFSHCVGQLLDHTLLSFCVQWVISFLSEGKVPNGLKGLPDIVFSLYRPPAFSLPNRNFTAWWLSLGKGQLAQLPWSSQEHIYG